MAATVSSTSCAVIRHTLPQGIFVYKSLITLRQTGLIFLAGRKQGKLSSCVKK
jgi:hypothetical protein